jgi:ABC-type enterochelin transport system permease subunit
MDAPSIMGMTSLFIIIAVPVSFVLLLIWIYRMNKNSEIQVEQNKRIIELLEKFHRESSKDN